MASPIYMGSDKYQIAKALDVGTELKFPLSMSATAPEVGIGAQRTNTTTGRPQHWNGTEWIDTGSDVDGSDWTPGNSFAS